MEAETSLLQRMLRAAKKVRLADQGKCGRPENLRFGRGHGTESCRTDSLRGPVAFKTRRGLQSVPKLTRRSDGSELRCDSVGSFPATKLGATFKRKVVSRLCGYKDACGDLTLPTTGHSRRAAPIFSALRSVQDRFSRSPRRPRKRRESESLHAQRWHHWWFAQCRLKTPTLSGPRRAMA
jgi:hypothetical protein